MFDFAKLLNHTFLFRSGAPFDTGAVLFDIKSCSFQKCADVKYFKFKMSGCACSFLYSLSDNDSVYGLGECMGALNRRGRKFRLYATDDPNHTPDKESLYGSHPFLIIDGERTFGIFIDYPSEITFDIGFSSREIMEIVLPSSDFDLYVFDCGGKLEIIREFLRLTGAPYVPPKWAFGYQQCRWSYPDAASIRDVANNFRMNEIPCDAIYMDIDYMEDYKVFTVDKGKFPDFGIFVKELRDMGFKLIPIIDPGVKIEDGYDVYEEGKERGCFCADREGNYFEAAVWPGMTHLPDFLNPEARKWWGGLHKRFTEAGIEGFWIDMNEPAIFYTPESLSELFGGVFDIKDGTVPDIKPFKAAAASLSNRRVYYRNFYHKSDDGRLVCNDDVHNLYGFYMARATAEGYASIVPGKRLFLLSRSSYIGLHRIAAVWMGDNMSWWEHMELHIKMLISLNMCGFFYTGADIGGFGCNASPDIVVRWTQLGVFTPLFRNHSATGTRFQEPWAFGEEAMAAMRSAIRLRYTLLPYGYSEFLRSVMDLKPFVSPLMLLFDSLRAKSVEDQFMYGDSIMVAPVYKENARGRFVHLPEVKWLFWPVSGYDERRLIVMAPGDYYVQAEIDRIPLFLKENCLVLLTEPVNYVGEKDMEELLVIGLVTGKTSFTYLVDDGASFRFQEGIISKLYINVERVNDSFVISLNADEREEVPLKIRRVRFEIYDDLGSVFQKEVTL